MGKKLFKDLDDFIEGGGRESPGEVNNEGNIESEDINRPDGAKQRDNIDSRNSNRPSPPDRTSIKPGENGPEDIDRRNISKSENAPDSPQHRGNISPRSFDKQKGEFESEIESREDIRPDEPDNEGNIERRGGRRPDEVDSDGSISPDRDRKPEIPDRDGIIEPGDFEPDDPDSRGNINSSDVRPSSPRNVGNIESEDNRPDDVESEENLDAREDQRPGDVSNEDNINADEDRKPDDTETEGNISVEEDRAPDLVQNEENIETHEDQRPSEPGVEDNITSQEEEAPDNIDSSGNIESREDSRPSDSETEGNIGSREDERPDATETEGNIEQNPENRPEGPETEGNIESREDRRPGSPEGTGNIGSREDERPEEPNVQGNIGPRDEQRPGEPDTDGNINSEDGVRPPEPEVEGNIESEDERPEEVRNEDNIETQEDQRPETSEVEDNIDSREEQRPEDVGSDDNITSREEERPQDAEIEGNIESQEEEKPEDVQAEGNIEVDDDEKPEDVQSGGNIESRPEQRPDTFSGSRPRGRGEDDINRLNREERLETFDQFFTIAQDQGASFVLRRPVAGGGNNTIANLKQGDSREAPVGSVAEDVVRVGRFLSSPRGVLYNIRQQFLQQQNPRRRTRIYDPSSLPNATSVGMTDRPGRGITRHLDGGGIVGSGASALFGVPESSKFEDELEDRTIQTEWGEMTGNLFWLSPVAQRALPDVEGEEARTRVQERLSNQASNILPITNSSDKESLATFGAAFSLRQLTGYLFTKDFDPQGGPNTEDRSLLDKYHPGAPYVLNADRVHDRDSFGPEGFDAPQLGDQARPIIDIVRTVQNNGAPFPFHNPDRTLSQPERVFGDGTVRTLMQNRSTNPEVFYENRITRSDEGGRPNTPLHRGVQNNNRSRGLPNYSVRARTDDETTPEKYLDLINAEPPAIGPDVNLDAEEYGPEENRYSDLIPFKFIDVPNRGRIIFRAFLEGISDNLSPEWSQEGYSGRPEEAHIYGGYSNTLSFSFQVVPFSETEFEVMWEKLNYLKGLTTPAQYNPARGGGSYMVPPFLRLTIGDLFNDVFGYINSLTISVNDDIGWETNPNVGRLPKGIEVDVDWYVIQKRVPVARQKFYDAPFLDERSRANATSQPPEPVDPISRGENDDPPRETSTNLADVADELVGNGGSFPQFDRSSGTPDSGQSDPELRSP